MINTLLFIHLIIALLLIAVILLQKTSTDGLSGIGGGNNMGLVSGRSATNFLTRTTVILGTLFFVNALILANLSSSPKETIAGKINASPISSEMLEEAPSDSLPIAK